MIDKRYDIDQLHYHLIKLAVKPCACFIISVDRYHNTMLDVRYQSHIAATKCSMFYLPNLCLSFIYYTEPKALIPKGIVSGGCCPSL